jgi:hypothetical protein
MSGEWRLIRENDTIILRIKRFVNVSQIQLATAMGIRGESEV